MEGVVLLPAILQEVAVAHGAVGHIVADGEAMCSMHGDTALEVVVQRVVGSVRLAGVDLADQVPVDGVATLESTPLILNVSKPSHSFICPP